MGKNKQIKNNTEQEIENSQKLEETKRISKGFVKNNPKKSK